MENLKDTKANYILEVESIYQGTSEIKSLLLDYLIEMIRLRS